MTTPITAPEQLTMLSASDQPLQFRLDARTRKLGINQLATIRSQMQARRAVQVDEPVGDLNTAPRPVRVGDGTRRAA
jgi:hypothetical protein